MIKGTIDRFEGGFAVVEIRAKSANFDKREELIFIHILAQNFFELPNEGDVINIESVNNKVIDADKDVISKDTLNILALLEKPVLCKISMDFEDTGAAKSRIDALADELFED